MSDSQASVEVDLRLCVDVLSYLGDRPRARDTFEGVSRWWLRRLTFERELIRLRRAVDYLTRRGFLEVDRRSDGNDHLSLMRDADVNEMIDAIRLEDACG